MKLKKLTSIPLNIFLFTIVAFPLNGDDFPETTQFSEDGLQMITTGTTNDGFYAPGILRNVYLEFHDADYWTQMEDNYNTEKRVLATMTVEDKVYENVGVQFKGMTSYVLLRGSLKASFDIKVDWVEEGQDIKGYETLNFNNAFEDDSLMKEVLYCNQIINHVPAAKANFINLYINGENWGVYSNVQQMNKDFLKEWFTDKTGPRWRAIEEGFYIELNDNASGGAPGTGGPGMPGSGPMPGSGGRPGENANFGAGLSAMNYLGDAVEEYTPYYTLKTDYETSAEEDIAWQRLIEVCTALEFSDPETLYQELNPLLDIDRTLWFLACEIIYGDEDSYVNKGTMDYYIYINPDTNRMTPMEYDGNSWLSDKALSWSIFMNVDNPNFPLLNRLLNVPEIRQRYLAHVRTILKETFTLENSSALIRTYNTLIEESAGNDDKKDGTFNDYLRGVETLEEVIDQRIAFLSETPEVAAKSIPVEHVVYYSANEAFRHPDSLEPVTVTASVLSENINMTKEVNLYYLNGTSGVFTKVQMSDAGANGDTVASDGIFSAQIPGFENGAYVRFYVETVSFNEFASREYFPSGAEHNTFYYRVTPVETESPDLVINELMASNGTILIDEHDEFDDWVEIYNKGTTPLTLTGYYLSDEFNNPKKWQFPNVTVLPNSYVVVWVDDDEEDQGELHASFKLSKEGEELLLSDPEGNPIDFTEFGNQETDISWARSPNGSGDFKLLQPSPGNANPTVVE